MSETPFRRRRLRRSTTPFPDESARGLVCRALGDHGVPRSWTVLKLVGLQHRNVVSISEDPELDLAELAWILRIDADELLTRRYPALPARRRSFFGMDVPAAAIEDRVRRFSPSGLAKSPHVRAAWELRDLPFCAETWDMLVDSCRCGVVQRFVRLNHVERCDDCGRPLSLAPTEQVPPDLRSDLSLVAGIASPIPEERENAVSRLPPSIGGAARGAVFESIMRVRRSVAGPTPTPQGDLRALASACAAVVDWPTGIRRLEAGTGTTRSTWMRAIAAYLALGGVQGHGRSRTVAPGAGGAPLGRKHGTLVRNGLIGMHPATKLTGLAPATLLAARERGHLGTYERLFGDRVLPAFDPEELRAFADAFRRRVSIGAIGARVGLGSWAVQAIGAKGLLGAPGLAMHPHDLCFDVAAVASFEDAIATTAARTVPDPVPLHRALLSVHGLTKPWGSFVAALLAGQVAYDLEGPGDLPFRRMRVPGDTFEEEAWRGGAEQFGTRIVKQHALEILNCDYKSDILEAVSGSGVNPVLYEVEDVVEIGRRAISSTELGWTRRASTRRIHGLLKRLGVPKLASDFWSRPEIERALAEGLI